MLVAQVDVHLPITWKTSGSCMLLNAMRRGNSVQIKGGSLHAGHELATARKHLTPSSTLRWTSG